MNVFDEEKRGFTALYTPSRSEDGITVAILLELLRNTATSLPVIVDTADSGVKKIIDGNLITEYLLDRYDKDLKLSYPEGSNQAREVDDWLSFLNGSAHHFQHPSGDNLSGGETTPSVREVLRIYLHLELQLQKMLTQYLVGSRLTLADLVAFPFAATADSYGLDLERFPQVTAWYNRLMSEHFVRRALAAVKIA
ncbi:glutathione S-transferase [Aspergillus pseudodeflectus]|uniref:Glutathione S-transferase n=1 Tax=Aspergillus pseudodeflectus TaxID=176178 RepID=A0ABR4JNY8_9EURO